MASIGRIALALASGTQETTLALANLNLDFSMIKLEAPTAFGQLQRPAKVQLRFIFWHVCLLAFGLLQRLLRFGAN